MQTLITNFIESNLGSFTDPNLPAKVIKVTDLTETLDDPDNEILLLFHIEIGDHDVYYSDHEPCINIRRFNNSLQSQDFANGDYAITIEPYIGLNASILLPITCLK